MSWQWGSHLLSFLPDLAVPSWRLAVGIEHPAGQYSIPSPSFTVMGVGFDLGVTWDTVRQNVMRNAGPYPALLWKPVPVWPPQRGWSLWRIFRPAFLILTLVGVLPIRMRPLG